VAELGEEPGKDGRGEGGYLLKGKETENVGLRDEGESPRNFSCNQKRATRERINGGET